MAVLSRSGLCTCVCVIVVAGSKRRTPMMPLTSMLQLLYSLIVIVLWLSAGNHYVGFNP